MKEKISCVCITHQRVNYLKDSISYFKAQTYENKDLNIFYMAEDEETNDFVNSDNSFNKIELIDVQKNDDNILKCKSDVTHKGESNIYFYRIQSKEPITLGDKRNLATQSVQGEYICIWDDDDIYSKDRLFNQKNFIEFSKKPACALASLIIYDKSTGKRYLANPRNDGWEGTLMCLKSEMGIYSSLNKQEDTPVLHHLLAQNKLSIMDDPELYTYCLHGQNTSSGSHFNTVLNYAELLILKNN